MKLKNNMLKHIMIDSGLKLRQLEKLSGVSKQTLSAAAVANHAAITQLLRLQRH